MIKKRPHFPCTIILLSFFWWQFFMVISKMITIKNSFAPTFRSFLCTVLYFLCAFSAKMATYSLVIALHEKKNFRLMKIWKRTEKIIFSLVFLSFRFTEKSYFLDFSSNENVRKQHLSANVHFA